MYNISNLIADDNLNIGYLEDISKTLYYATGLPVNILDELNNSVYKYGENTSIIDTFKDTLKDLHNFVYKIQAKSINGVSTYTSVYGFSYITAVLANENKYYGSLLLGPVLLEPPSEHIINKILQKTGLSLTKRVVVKNAIENITVINNARNYYICKMINNILASNMIALDDYTTTAPPEDYNDTFITQQAIETTNHNYGLERLFISKVSSGDIENVKQLFKDQIKSHYFINLGIDQLRPIKNNGIIFSTLLGRAAIDGGVEPNIALSLAETYNNKIEDIYRYNELLHLIEQMILDFTNHVLQTSEVSHVSVVKNVSKYIHAHLSEQIRLNDVAAYVNLSPNYFSSLFKREMGIAFADYLNEIRIKESQYLLETTDYSIVDIAIAVGFNNQNYFTTIFRKHTGTTPKQFRMKSSMK